MATRRDETVNVRTRAAPPVKAPAHKAAARKTGPAAKKARAAPNTTAPTKKAGAQALLRAGLQALGNVRDDVVKRQTNVIESLLGIAQGKPDAAGGKAAPARAFPSLDSFGIRKFEDVFDQRVATALQRLGMPSAQELQQLRDEVRQLREQLARIESGRRKR
jgi:hypothetical protein